MTGSTSDGLLGATSRTDGSIVSCCGRDVGAGDAVPEAVGPLGRDLVRGGCSVRSSSLQTSRSSSRLSVSRVARQPLSGRDRHRRVGELDHGRAVDHLAAAERGAVVDRRVAPVPWSGQWTSRVESSARPALRGRRRAWTSRTSPGTRASTRTANTSTAWNSAFANAPNWRSYSASKSSSSCAQAASSIGAVARSAPGPTGAAARRSASARPAGAAARAPSIAARALRPRPRSTAACSSDGIERAAGAALDLVVLDEVAGRDPVRRQGRGAVPERDHDLLDSRARPRSPTRAAARRRRTRRRRSRAGRAPARAFAGGSASPRRGC